MRTHTSLALLLLALAAPSAAFAAGAPSNFLELSNFVVQLLDNATAVLIAAAIVVYFFGISSKMIKVGTGETQDMRSYLMWGIAIIFVMVSIWGILRLLQNTLFGGTGYTGATAGSAPTCTSFGSCSFGTP
jgi:hypothetical protein